MRFPGSLPLFAGALLAAVFLSASAQTTSPAQLQQNRVADSVSMASRVTLAGHLAPTWARASNDLGSVPDSSRVQLIFALSRSPEVQAAFAQLLDDQQNPNSPRYHQWLTPAEVGQQFGPTQHDVDALTAWLTSAGFSVDSVTPSRTFVEVSAPAAVVSAALATSLHTYTVRTASGPEVRQAPTAEPSLPAALAPVVAYIGGLTSMPQHIHSHFTAHTAPAVSGGGTLRPNLTAGTSSYFLAPGDFNKIYDVPAAITGAGQKVTIIGGSRLNPADLSYWETDTALAGYTPNYIVGTGFSDPGQTNDDNMGEGTLDFERVYGTAPGASIDQVIAYNWLNGTVSQNLILYAINTVNDPVMSLSFGACEVDEPAGYVKTEDSMYSQAAAQGITVLVSSGDSGVAGCDTHGSAPPATQVASISDICATSYVTCVGGTEFNDASNYGAYWSSNNGAGYLSALGYIPEGAWNEPAGSGTTPFLVAASGGGPSTIIVKPSFQTGTGVPADGFRDTPDVSFSAAGHDGYFACLAYAFPADDTGCVPQANANGSTSFGFVAFSGTSASAPSMAGVAALVDQKIGARQGNLNPTLYRLAASTPAAFHDATIATSGVSGCTTATPSMCNNSDAAAATLTGGIAGYALQTGYDLVTGLGSLDVNAFLTAAAATAQPGTTSTLTASPATITTAQTVVFTDIVSTTATTGTPTGTVTFTTNSGLNLGTVALAANTTTNSETAATAALSFPTAGTYIVTAAYGGSSTFAASSATATLVVSVPPLPSTTTVLTGTTGTITALTPTSYTASVSPTATNTLAPGGTVQFQRTSAAGASANLGAAVPVVSGKATLTGVTIPTGAYTITAVYLGDTNFAGSTSNGLSVTSTSVATTTTLSGVPATATSTTSFVASAAVISSTGTGTPTGTVQFTVDAVAYGVAAALPATGSASLTLTLGAGTHMVCALYSGDTTFSSSTSTPCKSVTVTATPITAALTAATTTPYSYQTDMLTVTFSGTSPSVAAPSVTTFTDVATSAAGTTTTTVLGTASSGTTGSASLTAGPLAVGTHKITATYPGDAVYSAATSNTITLTVAASTITLTPASATLATPAGTTVTDAITLTDTNYAGNENLACSVVFNGSAGANTPSCTVNPASLTLSGSGTSTATISLSSVKSTAVTGSNFASTYNNSLLGKAGLGGAALCSLLAFCFPRRRKIAAVRAARLFASMLFLAATLFALAGCSGNNFQPNHIVGTTAGSYTVTVTAASSYVSASTTVSLTVQ